MDGEQNHKKATLDIRMAFLLSGMIHRMLSFLV